MSGEIPEGGILDVLREIESRRITGRIVFSSPSDALKGEVEIAAGQIALDQTPMKDGADPVEVLLKMRGGHYVVHQRLPPLAVTHGDDDHRSGSLEIHVPADLMNYCEQGGLTGTLSFRRQQQHAELVYEAGELLAIRLDGQDDADLSDVFAWPDGMFDIVVGQNVRALVPSEPPQPAAPPPAEDDPRDREPTTQFVRPRKPDETGKSFLKVFEVALKDVVATREKARPAKRTSPPRTPAPSVRPPAPAMPKIAPHAPRRREQTVRIVYLAGDDESALAAIDHAARMGGSGSRSPEPASIETREAPPSDEVTIDPPKPEKKSEARKPTIAETPKAKQAAGDEMPASKPKRARDDEPRATSARVELAPRRDSGRPTSSTPPPSPTPSSAGLGMLGWSVAVLALALVVYLVLTRLSPALP
jgi:hypothetical protein